MRCAVIDFETTGLRSDSGFLMCGGIKELGKPAKILGLPDYLPTSKDPLLVDHRLAVAIRDEMEKYDVWITQNGKMFDVPYLNDRLLLAGERELNKKFHIDIMYYFRGGQSRFSSSRLAWTSEQLDVSSRKTPLSIKVWKRAQAEALAHYKEGDKAYRSVAHHCKLDLLVTEQVYERVKPRIKNIHR